MEEHSLQVFENRALRRIFGLRRHELKGSRIKLHIEKLHTWYSSSDIIMMIRSSGIGWAGHVTCMGEMRNGAEVWS
jgi:hypothetical protein